MKEVSGEWKYSAEIWSEGNAPIELCWKKTDSRGKKVFLTVTRNIGLTTDHADSDLLDSVSEDLNLVKTELAEISKTLSYRTVTMINCDAFARIGKTK